MGVTMRYIWVVLFLVMFSGAATAQETQPGDSCTAGQLHQMRQVAGPGNGGTGRMLVCDGATWNPVFRWNAESGSVIAKIGPDGTNCLPAYAGSLRFSSASFCLEVCTGATWKNLCVGMSAPLSFDFTDATNAPLNQWAASNIVLIHGITDPVDVMAGGAGTPQYRICSDNICASVVQNWGSGTGSITNGQYLQVRLTSANTGNTTRTAYPIIVGNVTADWNVTTIPLKTVFVTSLAYDGNLGGIAGADSRCNTRASAAGLSGTFKAWISGHTAVSSPSNSFTPSGTPYVMVNGTVIANNWSDLVDGTLQNAITIDEIGGTVASGNVWTGTKADGANEGTANTHDHCSTWGSGSSLSDGYIGVIGSATATWTDGPGTAACNTTARLYCFQQ